MYWKTLKQALLEYFESGSESKEDFARYIHIELDQLNQIMDCDDAPSYDVGKEIEGLLKATINGRVGRHGESALLPGR